jgi:hypothetical protein
MFASFTLACSRLRALRQCKPLKPRDSGGDSVRFHFPCRHRYPRPGHLFPDSRAKQRFRLFLGFSLHRAPENDHETEQLTEGRVIRMVPASQNFDLLPR